MDEIEIAVLIVVIIVVLLTILFCACRHEKLLRARLLNERMNDRMDPRHPQRCARRGSDNIYVISMEGDRPSNYHDQPPEYKWEELPPSYEEAVRAAQQQQSQQQPEST